MYAGRRQPDDGVAFANILARQDRIALHGADREPGEVVSIALIDSRHFGRFAADQRATSLAAAPADSRNHRGCDFRLESSASVIVEKEERFGALHYKVVYAHCDQIDPDRVVAPTFNRDLELRS